MQDDIQGVWHGETAGDGHSCGRIWLGEESAVDLTGVRRGV
jgi:hypothetical protein